MLAEYALGVVTGLLMLFPFWECLPAPLPPQSANPLLICQDLMEHPPHGGAAGLEAQVWLTEQNCGCDGLAECHPVRLELGDVWDCPTHLYIMIVMDKGLNVTVGIGLGRKEKNKEENKTHLYSVTQRCILKALLRLCQYRNFIRVLCLLLFH